MPILGAEKPIVPPIYTVYGHGTHYHADPSIESGKNRISGADAIAVINGALSNLTIGRTLMEKVVLKGDFIINSPIIQSGYTYLDAQAARITLANNSNCNMWQNANQGTYDVPVVVDGGIWNGNRANQTSGHIFSYICGSAPAAVSRFMNVFQNMKPYGAKDNGFEVDLTSGIPFRMFNVHFAPAGSELCEEYAIHLKNVYDGQISMVRATGASGGAAVHAVYVEDSGPIQFTNFYSGAGMVIHSSTCIKMSDFWVEHAGLQDALILDGSFRCTFSEGTIHMIEGSEVRQTKSGIKLQVNAHNENCIDNVFGTIYVGRASITGNRIFLYGVEESNANQNYNIFCNINGRDSNNVAGGAALRALGANSVVGNVLGKVILS